MLGLCDARDVYETSQLNCTPGPSSLNLNFAMMWPEPQALSTLAHALPRNCIFGLLCMYFFIIFLQAQELHYWGKRDSAGALQTTMLEDC